MISGIFAIRYEDLPLRKEITRVRKRLAKSLHDREVLRLLDQLKETLLKAGPESSPDAGTGIFRGAGPRVSALLATDQAFAGLRAATFREPVLPSTGEDAAVREGKAPGSAQPKRHRSKADEEEATPALLARPGSVPGGKRQRQSAQPEVDEDELALQRALALSLGESWPGEATPGP